MKKLLSAIILCSLFANPVMAYKSSKKEVHSIFNKLTRSSGISAKLKLVGGDQETYSLNDVIQLSTTETYLCNNDSACIASILAHELIHCKYNDNYGRNNNLNRQLELRADTEAVDVLRKAGYDPCAGAKIFKKLRAQVGEAESKVHPPLSQRIEAIEKVCK